MFVVSQRRSVRDRIVFALALAACHGDGGANGSGNASDWGASSGAAGSGDASEASGADDTGGDGPGFDPAPEPACVADDVLPPAGTVYTLAGGDWSDPSIWNGGAPPAAGDDVVVQRCHRVRYDVDAAAALHTLVVHGQLEFASDVDTRLAVGLAVVTGDPSFDPSTACAAHDGGHMHGVAGDDPHIASISVGTPGDPIAADVEARIVLTPATDLDADCAPAMVAQGGRLEFHGAPIGPAWSELAATAPAGATSVRVVDPLKWRVGDTILLSATDFNDLGRDQNSTYLNGELEIDSEVRTITAIEDGGTTLVFAEPLVHEHGIVPSSEGDLSGEVGNLSRNVVVTSADPAGPYGHVMWHHGSSGGVSYAEFRDLGKTDTLGRYPVHFHKVQNSMRGTQVVGASIWGAHNRWMAIHATEYLVVRDLVAYQTHGHGIFLEDASEQYNLVDHALLVQAYASEPIADQALDYDQNNGACYWAANARNFVTDSVFVECGDSDESFTLDYRPDDAPMPTEMLQPDGTRTVVDARTVSGGRYQGLEFHNHRGWAFWLRGGSFPLDEPLQVRDLVAWRNHYTIDVSGTGAMLDGVRVYFTPYGFYNNFPGSHRVRNAYMFQACYHGAFMTYLGGSGVQLYEDVRIDECAPNAWRIDAKNEGGANGTAIEIHARGFEMLAPDPNYASNWAGTEDDSPRTDPLLMLVMHDAFGPDSDAVVLPGTQSPDLPGVPAGLSFDSGASVVGPQGLHFAGRGTTLVATGDVPFPEDHPLMHQVDRVPPATIITSPSAGQRVRLGADGKLVVRGVALDASAIADVTVNGVPAELAANGMDWSVEFTDVPEGGITLSATSSDSAGLAEQLPHGIVVWIDRE